MGGEYTVEGNFLSGGASFKRVTEQQGTFRTVLLPEIDDIITNGIAIDEDHLGVIRVGAINIGSVRTFSQL